MRVAIDARKIDDFGIGTHVRGLVGGLVRLEEPELTLILPEQTRVEWDVEIVRSSARGYSIRELSEIGRLAMRRGVDLLHLPHYVVPFGSMPMTVTIHDTIHLQRDDITPVARLYARTMLGRAVSKCRAVFTPSQAVAADLMARWPRAATKTVVTPNAVSDTLLRAKGGEVPLELQGVDYALFVGNDKPHKNVGRLVGAMGVVREAHPELRLALVGGEFDQFEQPWVIRPGLVDEPTLRVLYENARLLVQPSLFEGFGLPVLEAMALGTPVAFAAIPALLEVAGSEAISFNPLDEESMATAIRSVLDDPSLERHVENGRRRAAGFSWDAAAETTLDAWRRVLS